MMSNSNKSSSNCLQCVELKAKVSKLEEALAFVEAKTRDCVRAYRTVLKEKNMIVQNFDQSKELFAKRVEEEEKRLATLEDSLCELSSICGKYEAENIKKQTLIDKLNQRCDELTKQMDVYESTSSDNSGNKCDNVNIKSDQHGKLISRLINQWTQTIMIESDKDKTEEPPEMQFSEEINTQDQETQTCSELVNVNYQSGNKQRKTECAIVLPTHREIEVEKSTTTNVDSRRGSHGSRGSGSETVFTDTESQPFESIRPSLNSSNSMVHQEVPSNSVSLFYVNELARKEIELVETRLTARENECALRELRWKYNVDTFKLQSKLARLEQQLQQIQNDDTSKPNLTYIRNVLIRFLKTKDKKQKTCMMNALLTALGVDQKEIKM